MALSKPVIKVAPSLKVSREGGRAHVVYDEWWKHTSEWIGPDWLRRKDASSHTDPQSSPTDRINQILADMDSEPEVCPRCGCLQAEEEHNEEDDNASLVAYPLEDFSSAWTESSLETLFEDMPDINANTLVPCPNKCKVDTGIGEEILHVLHKDLLDHLKYRCTKRMVECPNCKVIGPYYIIMGQHDAECGRKKIPCLNDGCNLLVRRCKMKYHILHICGYTEVPCDYFNLGCPDVMLKKDTEQHNDDAWERHLTYALDKLSAREEQNLILSEGEAFTFKITNFTAKCVSNEPIKTRPFYIEKKGYKMDVLVFVNGDTDSNEGNISIFLRPQIGIYDYTLSWPILGTAQMSILNQAADENHYSQTLQCNEEDNVHIGSVLHSPQFITHDHLINPPNRFIQYLTDDTIYFRVTVTPDCGKPWLKCT